MSLEVICLYPSNPTIHRGGINLSDDLALAMTDEIVVGSMAFSSYPYNK